MREIKFRAWSFTGKQMIQWEKMREDRKTLYKYFDWADVYHLMQYTGLKDKNGKEIYEGDLLQMYKYPPFIMEWVVSHNNVGWTCFSPQHEAEVVGNIYENKELLEGIK